MVKFSVYLNRRVFVMWPFQIEERQGRGDDTALNGIKLICGTRSGISDGSFATSKVGLWGDWLGEVRCNGGQVMSAFALQVEEWQVETLFMRQHTTNPTIRSMRPAKSQPAQPRSLIRVFADRLCIQQPPGYQERDKQEPLPYWVAVLCWSYMSYCMFCRALARSVKN